MNTLSGIVAVVSMLLAAGCGTVILKADLQSPPSGTSLPGPPDDDHALLAGTAVVSGGSLTLQAPPSATATFISRPVEAPEAKKWISWTGQLAPTLGSAGSVFVYIYGRTSVSGNGIRMLLFPFLEISVNQIKVLEGSSSSQPPQSIDANLTGPHNVFLSVRPKSKTFRISVTQKFVGETVLTGDLSTATATSLKDHPRVVLSVTLTSSGSVFPDAYEMSDVRIREVQ